MAFSYVIEHMEEDEPEGQIPLPEWVKLEYLHMRTVAGLDAHVQFTNLSLSSTETLSSLIASEDQSATKTRKPSSGSGLARASAHQEGVLKLMERLSVPLERVCLLDPKADLELSPEDGQGAFDWFLFGGILGDDPPRDRTAELRKLGFPTRHLGPIQMTTDTAVAVTKRIVHDKTKLNDIVYTDFPFISVKSKEGVEMPFRYIAVDEKPQGEPLMPPGMRELILKDMDRSFEFGDDMGEFIEDNK